MPDWVYWTLVILGTSIVIAGIVAGVYYGLLDDIVHAKHIRNHRHRD